MCLLSGLALLCLPPYQTDGTLARMKRVVVRDACGNLVRLFWLFCRGEEELDLVVVDGQLKDLFFRHDEIVGLVIVFEEEEVEAEYLIEVFGAADDEGALLAVEEGSGAKILKVPLHRGEEQAIWPWCRDHGLAESAVVSVLSLVPSITTSIRYSSLIFAPPIVSVTIICTSPVESSGDGSHGCCCKKPSQE